VAKNPTVEFNSIEVRIVRQIFFSREADGFASASLEGVSTTSRLLLYDKDYGKSGV
jgi:hypothetical protein